MKKLVSLALCGALVFSLAGCASGEKMESNSSVVATVNGENITREDVGADFVTMEKEAILSYLNTKLVSEFFADVEVPDEEVQLQMDLIKSQLGSEEQWNLYLMYYGGGSEEAFKEMVRESYRTEKYISEKMKTLTISDEKLAETYNKNPNQYNIALMDAIFFGEVGQIDIAKEKLNNGESMEEIATFLGTEVYPDRNTYFESDIIWEVDLNTAKVGDIVFTTTDSGSYVMGKIKELNIGLDNPTVKKDLMDSMLYEEAYALVDAEVGEYLKKQNIMIFGEEASLVEEETAASSSVEEETAASSSETLTGAVGE